MKLTNSLLCGMLALGLASSGALAQSSGAHYQKGTTGSIATSGSELGDLTISWTEAGLGNFDVTYTLTADVSAVYFCRTNSGSIPNASNKTTSNGSASTNGTFSPKNGKVTASLILEEPATPASAPPTCGGGQSLDLQSITWSNVVLTDTSYSDVFTFGNGTFTVTFFPAP